MEVTQYWYPPNDGILIGLHTSLCTSCNPQTTLTKPSLGNDAHCIFPNMHPLHTCFLSAFFKLGKDNTISFFCRCNKLLKFRCPKCACHTFAYIIAYISKIVHVSSFAHFSYASSLYRPWHNYPDTTIILPLVRSCE